MEISEFQLEELIWIAYNREDGEQSLFERGLDLSGKMYRQLNLGHHGIPDLLTFDATVYGPIVQIIELKKGPIDFKTLQQAIRYKVGLVDILRHAHKLERPVFEIILIGSEVDEILAFSTEFLNSEIVCYKYNFDPFKGIFFNRCSYTGYKTESTIHRPLLPDSALLAMKMPEIKDDAEEENETGDHQTETNDGEEGQQPQF